VFLKKDLLINTPHLNLTNGSNNTKAVINTWDSSISFYKLSLSFVTYKASQKSNLGHLEKEVRIG
jgi:hypothetical protein